MPKQLAGANKAGPIADSAVEVLRQLEQSIGNDLLRSLLRLDTNTGEDSLERHQVQTQAQVLKQIQDKLNRAGETIVSTAGAKAVEAVTAVLGAPVSTLSLDFRKEIDQIVDGQLREVTNQFRAAKQEIFEAVARAILGGQSLGDLVVEIESLIGTTFLKAMAAVDTAIMAAGRIAVFQDAQKVEEFLDLVYIYVGPKDKRNREFCAKWAGKACTNPEKLNNGQGLPVESFCGGYNCRHSWAPVPFDEAIAEGYTILHPNGQPAFIEVTQ